MNESLSITNLEAERLRRQVDHIAYLARSGRELPAPNFRVNLRGTRILLGPLEIALEWTELGGDPRRLVVHVANEEVEEKLYSLFQDKIVTKKLYDHIFHAFEEYMGKDNGSLKRYGDTKFCG